MKNKGYLRLLAAVLLSAAVLLASQSSGTVTLGGLPVPGATVTATQGDKKVTTVTDGMGDYIFPDLADGTWNIQVDLSGFTPLKQDVAVAAGAPPSKFELKMKPLSEIQAQIQTPELTETRPAPAASAAPSASAKNGAKAKPQANAQANANTQANAQANGAAPAAQQAASADQADESGQRAADGLLVNGSQLNGATTPFALNPAFGNNRRGLRSLYNFNLGFIINNSVLNARPYSQSGQDTPKAPYNNMTFLGAIGGPLRIPHVARNIANFSVQYQFNRVRNASTSPNQVPTDAERMGDLSSVPFPIIDPATRGPDGAGGTAFEGNVIPLSRISPQAMALLNLYPAPNNTSSGSVFNYQVALVSPSYFNAMQMRLNRQLGRKNSVYGTFAFQDINQKSRSAFQFVDPNHTLGLNVDPVWRHQFTPRMGTTLEFQFSRQSVINSSYFANRENVSGNAQITGNDQSPLYWGPPSLNFSSGIMGLTDAVPSTAKNQTGVLKTDSTWNHGRHNVTFGADLRRQQFNSLSENNPRGSFMFNGQATQESACPVVTGICSSSKIPLQGSDFADFLLGIPDTSSVAYSLTGADRYLRTTGYDAYVQDDWRVNSAVTLVASVRYEYNGPVSELYGRLVNLDLAPGFTGIGQPVLGSNPVGSLTGAHYPSSLVRPERYPFEPGLGLAWRPVSGSSLVVRSGYSLRYTPSAYQNIATQMYQQYPLATSLQASNCFPGALNCALTAPLSLENPFVSATGSTLDQFGIDPNFRESYVQAWYLSLQKDLPGGMQMFVRYDGLKGTNLTQFFYPNTYPIGAANPCASCPIGFRYEASNANSTRNWGTVQLRRRLHNGLTAQIQYVYSKAIDDSGTAQNWLNLAAERGLSNFDQRHQVTASAQYTTGMGIHGGNFLSGWRAAALKEWTFIVPVTWGTGRPLTPSYPLTFPGTSFSGIRPDYTGAPLTASGLFVNPAAFAAPVQGQFGSAGVGIITGPDQFSMGASMQRSFHVSDRVSMTVRVDANNMLNHVVFSSYNVFYGNQQFGLPINAQQMRQMQATFRFTF